MIKQAKRALWKARKLTRHDFLFLLRSCGSIGPLLVRLRYRGPDKTLDGFERTHSASRRARIESSGWLFLLLFRHRPHRVVDLGERAYGRFPDSRLLGTALALCHRRIGNVTRTVRLFERWAPDSPFLDEQRDVLALGEKGYPRVARAPHPTGAKTKRVLLALHQSLPHHLSGYAIRSHSILRAMRRTEWVAEPVTRLGYPGRMVPEHLFRHIVRKPFEDVDGIRYRRMPGAGQAVGLQPSSRFIHDYSDALASVVRDSRVSLLHAASNYNNGLAAAEVGRRLGLPCIYEVRGLWELTRASREPGCEATEWFRTIARLETQAADMADAVITLTEGLRNELVGRGIARDKIHLVPNAVEASKFRSRTRDEDLATRLGVRGKAVIGYMGSIVNYEGLDLLVEAAAHLGSGGRNDFRMLIVGGGAFEKELREKIERSDVSDRFVLPGRVPFDQVQAYYSLFDIAVFPRRAFRVCELVSPLKPFETMAMGIPVVASDVAAQREIVHDGQTGLLHRKDDAADLARVLERLLDDPAYRQEVAQAGRDWVYKERTWDTVIQRTITVYEQVVNR